MSDADDEILKMLDEFISRKNKPGGVTRSEYKKMLIAEFDTELHTKLGKVLAEHNTYSILMSFILIAGDCIGQAAGDEESICDTSKIIGEMLHIQAHHMYDERMKGPSAPTHDAPDTPQ